MAEDNMAPSASPAALTDESAMRTALRIIANLEDRSGVMDGIDDDTKQEIVDEIAVTILTASPAATQEFDADDMQAQYDAGFKAGRSAVQAQTDGGRNMFYEGLFDGETERQRDARLRWANDMRAAFERHTGNGWFDKAWHQETVLWAAAWRAATDAAPQPSAKALTDEHSRLLSRLMVGGCTCATKTPELKYHDANCQYRCASEIYDLLVAEQPTELPRHALEAWRAVVRERRRQIAEEGWTPEHDDEHRDYAMSCAAGCYAMYTLAYPAGDPPPQWPWAAEWWKPKDHRRNLERAGALILAELERLIRAKQKDAAITKEESHD